jgi:glutathione synthase
MDSWEHINPKRESTLRIIRELMLRGHDTSVIFHNNLTIRGTTVWAYAGVVTNKTVPENCERLYYEIEISKEMRRLRNYDALILRSDPPVDNIMLNFLDSIKGDVFIMNDIDGLRKAGNKIYPATLDDPGHTLIPVTHVSKDKDYLKSVIFEDESDRMIMKPLDASGGKGVIILEKSAKKNINSLLDFYINRDAKTNYVIIQEYIEGAENGDTRVYMLNGNILGAMRRVPAADDMRSNIHAGGTVVFHELSEREREICMTIGPKLIEDGLYFSGIDIIGDKIIEVNVTSPGGFDFMNLHLEIPLQKSIIDFVEKVVNEKVNLYSKKEIFRDNIQDV